MADELAPIELGPHDMTRVWNLAIMIYDGDNDDADLRDYFVQALQIYLEFTKDLAEGGTTFDDGTNEWRSERGLDAKGAEFVRFRAHKKEPPKVDKDKAKKKKK